MSKEDDLPIKIDEGKNIEGMSVEELEKNFKALASEILSGEVTVDYLMKAEEKSATEDGKDEIKPKQSQFKNYMPGIMDFLARAKTHNECEEIIEYCLRQHEISEEQATKLLNTLKQKGPDAFGVRAPGHYDKLSNSH